MKADGKKTQEVKTKNTDSEEGWFFIISVIIICITIVMTTRMYINANLTESMVMHYSMRGKDVIIHNEELVFVNN